MNKLIKVLKEYKIFIMYWFITLIAFGGVSFLAWYIADILQRDWIISQLIEILGNR